MAAAPLIDWIRQNWWVPLVVVALAIELAFAGTTRWAEEGGMVEMAIVFDLCLFLPTLYLICYRRTLPWRSLLMRAAGLACLGVYIASWLVPTESQRLIAELSAIRSAGFVLVAAIELWLVVKLVRLVFGGSTNAAEIASRHGTPEWVARLMLLEARFWKSVWRLLTGRR